MSGGNYRCKDCDESVDPKGGPHICDGSREEVLERLTRAHEENARLRAELQKVCRHPVSIDSLPAFCAVCGKGLP